MPPDSLPTAVAVIDEEDLQARRWAFDTIKLILSDTVPVSFKSDFNDLQPPLVISPIKQIKNNKQRKHSLKRSFSFFEGSLFGPSSYKSASRRSQSTIVVTTGHVPIQSEPCSPATKLSPPLDHHNLNAEFKVSPKLKKIEKRSDLLLKFIATELVTTEKTFLSHLVTIRRKYIYIYIYNVYMNPLLEAASSNPKLVNKKDVETIFAYIPQLISISSSMLKQLEESHHQHIGKVFCDYEKYLGVYIAYAANFSRSRKCLEKSSSNIVYRQLVQGSMRKRATNRMILSDYMIAPIQRVMRYCLLLKDLKKHSSPFKQDVNYLEKAIACSTSLAVAMDSVQ
ncbi:Dbl homology domain-containing protein [Backusella circina FSU 941]|nr:Dbl homology domain-containing protein [Backusella circina FSU 941]